MVGVRLLEKLGCRVDVAANGREAIEMVELLPYDVIFMDCQKWMALKPPGKYGNEKAQWCIVPSSP